MLSSVSLSLLRFLLRRGGSCSIEVVEKHCAGKPAREEALRNLLKCGYITETCFNVTEVSGIVQFSGSFYQITDPGRAASYSQISNNRRFWIGFFVNFFFAAAALTLSIISLLKEQ